MSTDIPTSKGLDGFSFDGRQSSWGTNSGSPVAGTTIQVGSSFVLVSPSALTVMTAMPTFSAPTTQGQFFRLLNQGTAYLVLQDQLILSGSALRLPTPSVALRPLETADFLAFNNQWLMLSHGKRL